MPVLSRLLIVDDHTMYRQALRALLDRFDGLRVVGEAGDGLKAIELTRELRPDLVLMDVDMPICGGVEATRRIQLEVPETRVILLSAHEDDANLIYQAVCAGALGCVSKTEDLESLLEGIRLVLKGQAFIASSCLTRLVNYLRGGQDQAGSAPSLMVEKLSLREQQVLALLGEGWSNRAIAERLVISESTVRNHVHNIFDKLQLTNRTQAVYALAVQRGSGHAAPGSPADASSAARRMPAADPQDGVALPGKRAG